jgi:hypothetical protein
MIAGDNELFLMKKFVFRSVEPKVEQLRGGLWDGLS